MRRIQEVLESMENYSVLPVTSTDDIPSLATVFLKASTEKDTFWEMFSRYGGSDSSFNTFLNVLKEAFEHPNHHLFKAVYSPTGEIVGMAHWKAPWYLEVEKVDPFAKVHDEPTGDRYAASVISTVKPHDPVRAAGVAMFKDSKRQLGNAYVTHVRGKKHVFLSRIGVLPDHQRKGIASRLMQWGTDFADEHGIVAFLNGRPAALELYESFGFKPVSVTHFKFDDLEVGPMTTMLRLPRPGRKIEL